MAAQASSPKFPPAKEPDSVHLQRVSLVPRATAGQTTIRFPDPLGYTATYPPGMARDAERRKKDEMFEGENSRAALQQLKKKKKKNSSTKCYKTQEKKQLKIENEVAESRNENSSDDLTSAA